MKQGACAKIGLLIVALGSVAPLPLGAIVSYTGGTYFENFDGLGTDAATWVNDSTLPGWYAYRSNVHGGLIKPYQSDDNWAPISSTAPTYNYYTRSIGQVNSGLLNLGTSNSSPNRSLGSLSTAGDYVFGVVLRNDTAQTFSDISLSYYGEQWQVNWLFAQPGMNLDFSYGVFQSFNGDPLNPNTLVPNTAGDSASFYAGYTNPAANALDPVAFQFGQPTPLDGTAPGNRQLLSGDLPVNWAPGQYLVLRWFDDENATYINSMLAVNDLQLTATPEPSRAVLLSGAFVAMLLRRRRKLSRPCSPSGVCPHPPLSSLNAVKNHWCL